MTKPIAIASGRRNENRRAALLRTSGKLRSPTAHLRRVPDDEPLSERRCTADTLLRAFAVYGVLVRRCAQGKVVSATAQPTGNDRSFTASDSPLRLKL